MNESLAWTIVACVLILSISIYEIVKLIYT